MSELNHARDDHRRDVALFRIAVLGDLVHQELRRGELKAALAAKAASHWRAPNGRAARVSAKTIESWLTLYRRGGFDALLPRVRSDRNLSRSIDSELVELIVDMKRERPGRSAKQIVDALVDVGRVKRGAFSISSVQRLLAARGLSGPKMELEVPARHRFRAGAPNALWQVDAVHGPALFDPAAGRATRVKIFGLIDDYSRLLTYARASFHERQEDFLCTLFEAIRRRGMPRVLLLDNHGSFTGADVKVVCAQLGINLVYARPYDGASKGKIERFWETLRGQLLDELNLDVVTTVDDLNLRVMTWVDARYNVGPHSSIDGRSPLSVFEESVDEVRFVSDFEWLASRFTVYIDRQVRNDATCTLGGRVLEFPQHMRRTKARIYYTVQRPESVWIMDGETQVFLRDVDPIANSRRPRVAARNEVAAPLKATGINGVEALLGRVLHSGSSSNDPDPRSTNIEGGTSCMPF